MKIAIVQKAPVLNNLNASTDLAVESIQEAALAGADLVIFAECWLSGYPAWLDYCRDVGIWDHPPVKTIWAEMYMNSPEIDGPEMRSICEEAALSEIHVALGLNEAVNRGKGNATLYNAAVMIGSDGRILNHHRKLMPTYTEKLVHGLGDGHGLNSVSINQYNTGMLICWEHWIPLARQAMHDAGEDIHIAMWPMLRDRHLLASRHYAFEGRCYVLAAGQILCSSQIPDTLDLTDEWKEKEYILRGGSCVFGPDGAYIHEPIYDAELIIYVDLPPREELVKERMNLAISGHYQRPDVFDLRVMKKRLTDSD